MKVGDLVRDRDDPSGEVGLIIRVVEKRYHDEESDLVVVKYPNARLFIYTQDLLLVSSAKERRLDRDE